MIDSADDTPTIEATAHDAASTQVRGLESWRPTGGSPDADLLPELDAIAHRSRDLERNHPLASSILQTYRDSIVGHVLSLRAKPDISLLGWSVEQGRAWSKSTQAQFHTWANSTECDASNSDHLIDLTQQILTGAFLNGDGLAIPVWIDRPGQGWKTKLLIIESDRLETPPHLTADPNIRKGVRIDRHGAPVGYWIRKTHPGDAYAGLAFGLGSTSNIGFSPADYSYIPAFTPWGRRRVIHLRDKHRPGATRGRGIFAPVIKEFFQAGKYAGAELSAAVVSAMITTFIESTMDSESVAQLFNSSEQGAEGHWHESLMQHRPQLREGSIVPLPIGAKASGFAPGRPNSAFAPFMNSILRHIAAGLHVPYELLVKDFSQTNYSSARAAILEAWRHFNGRRRWLIDHWFVPVYALWLEEAVELGRVNAPNYRQLKHAYLQARWTFAGRGWVDPVREARAAEMRLATGLSTLEQECAEQGLDWEDVAEQRAFEASTLQGLDLPPPGMSYKDIDKNRIEGETNLAVPDDNTSKK